VQLSRKNRFGWPRPAAGRPAGNVLNVPFQGQLCRSCRGSTNRKLFPLPVVRFLVTFHGFMARISPNIRDCQSGPIRLNGGARSSGYVCLALAVVGMIRKLEIWSAKLRRKPLRRVRLPAAERPGRCKTLDKALLYQAVATRCDPVVVRPPLTALCWGSDVMVMTGWRAGRVRDCQPVG
jgi:hypothetical protein